MGRTGLFRSAWAGDAGYGMLTQNGDDCSLSRWFRPGLCVKGADEVNDPFGLLLPLYLVYYIAHAATYTRVPSCTLTRCSLTDTDKGAG